MRYPEELQLAVNEVASNPKISATVSVATASLGTAWFADLIQGTFSIAAIISGVIATVFLIRVHWITFKNRSLENKILRKQALDLGIDLTKD